MLYSYYHFNSKIKNNVVVVFLCIYFLFCISSCKRNNFYTPESLSVVCENGIADSLYGIEIAKENNCYLNIYAHDSLLFLFSNNKDSLIHIYNMNDNSLVCKIGQIGHGKKANLLHNS